MGASAGPKIVTDGLVLYLDAANERSYPGSGTTWKDLSGNGITGNINGPIFNNASNGGFIFDGTDDFCSFDISGKNINVGLDTTVCCFLFRASTTTLQRNIISTRSGGDGGSLYIGSKFNQIFSFYGQLSSRGYVASSFPNNTFLYIVVRLNNDGSITHISLGDNIFSVSTSSPRTGFIASNNNQLRFSNDLEFFEGSMFSYQHYNRALTEAEITQNFNALRGRYGI